MGDFLHVLYTHLIQFFSMIRLNDVIDILIIAYVCYLIIKLVRETRAQQLIKGIVVLVLATQISGWLSLNTVNFVLRNMMQVGVLALIVMFQPELRRFLEKVGRSSFKDIFNPRNVMEQSQIDSIVNAVSVMSEERTGALIVFEKTSKIGDIIRTGVTIDSEISQQLILNIFIKNTPLHDGAMIIRDGKIAAASCLLPLSQNEGLSQELGTRHRAAIGITEHSDVVVVVVSEETGKISFAKEGNLQRAMSPEAIGRALMKEFTDQPVQGDGVVSQWKERFTRGRK
ncbi:MAG: diadenylate cyclase CdaA [Bacillota bacterium]|nr:diadenylate cyclase CdaA [Bacillota bacterium]